MEEYEAVGSLVISILLKYGWGWSMIVPSILIAFSGMIVFLLLTVHPKSVECNNDEVLSLGKEDEEVNEPLTRSNREEKLVVGFSEARMFPGVEMSKVLLHLVKLIEKHNDQIATFETWDIGKPYKQAVKIGVHW
ncbi:hypothetical protein RDI58_012604 [Solanum bulbocastanum]|uniref:Uncharacterized protein n=1 Tax=Solanum bulbocastanum TaxID=147425 RepID=A0AAN8TNM6_SOLBU